MLLYSSMKYIDLVGSHSLLKYIKIDIPNLNLFTVIMNLSLTYKDSIIVSISVVSNRYLCKIRVNLLLRLKVLNIISIIESFTHS